MIKRCVYLLFCLLLSLAIFAQSGNKFINPMAHEVSLSGNFGELRATHFHAGLDFRTKQRINLPVVSVADGYISRISVSPVGFGKALYVTHPQTGHTSLYAHLNKFVPRVDSIVRAYQYANQSFSVDFTLSSDILPVVQGERIAYSGNTGSSGGPHLHFEIRDTETGFFLDPLPYITGVVDNRLPQMRLMKIYPQAGKGVVNGSTENSRHPLTTNARGVARFTNPTTITAWGKLGLGIKAFDFTDNAPHILGIRTVVLEVDDEVIFHSEITKIDPRERFFINSFRDYEEFRTHGNHVMKSFIDEGNFLNHVYQHVVNRGFFVIDEERDYSIRYTLTDFFGNTSILAFTIRGEKSEIPEKELCGGVLMPFYTKNYFENNGVNLSIPLGALYTDLCFHYENIPAPEFFSDFHQLHFGIVPLHYAMTVTLQVTDETADGSKLFAARVNEENNRLLAAHIGTFEDMTYTFQTRRFGRYVLKKDTIPPQIRVVNFSNFAQRPYISFRITDRMSGIGTFNGFINGNWVLFEFDEKNDLLKYYLDEGRIGRNREHQLKLVVTDRVGNESVFTRNFRW